MTPVILLSDAFIGNGSSAWRVPDDNEYPEIHPRFVPEELREAWRPYLRDEATMARYWAIPGTEGLMHRLGGLEKDYNTGALSIDPKNHEKMVFARREKVERVALDIPELDVMSNGDADTILIGWGGTYGHLRTAAEELINDGCKVDFAHFRYINPLPRNTKEVLSRYKNVICAELNTGQFADFLQSRMPGMQIKRINKIQGQPFLVSEIVAGVKDIIAK
jgi:2-oxoglutarate ferredoxin oxidoreductase subunit alpha